MSTNQQLIEHNFEEKIKAFTYAVGGEFNSEETFSIANTGVPTDTFNTLLIKSKEIKDSFKVRQKLDYLTEMRYPFSVWMDVEHMNANWENILQNYNLKEAERNVMMKRENALHAGERISNQLTITQVKSNEELVKYIDVFISLFEGSTEQEALERYFNKFSQIKLGPDVLMYVGNIDGIAVTTGLLIKSKESYGIYDVMTKEAARGKGYGSEMFQYLLNQTKDKQKPVVLQASEDGRNIYKRFGFASIGEMVVFE
ncbi:MAG TPA: GNAT family N-acetyltransferase [Virgibacillus sp.]|nr:GNAT family N-acetyltransferase [Virgibacillus sp.]HLR65572.1 GNAT family N-acetyltransferase [Virgibacillus sp.]